MLLIHGVTFYLLNFTALGRIMFVGPSVDRFVRLSIERIEGCRNFKLVYHSV